MFPHFLDENPEAQVQDGICRNQNVQKPEEEGGLLSQTHCPLVVGAGAAITAPCPALPHAVCALGNMIQRRG